MPAGTRKDVGNPMGLEPGEFGRSESDGNFHGRTPAGVLLAFDRVEVTEHPDGTISAHGIIENGVWQDV